VNCSRSTPMLLGRTLRVLLWAAFCHCCVAQYCAAYCRWDIMNCRTNAAACGACEICRAPGAQAKIAAVIAAKEIRGDEDGPNPSGVVCEAWCNAEVAKSHCINKVCKPCDFCQNYNSACEHWCKPDRGHCPDERCSGCAKCAGFSKAPQKLGAPAQAPALAPGTSATRPMEKIGRERRRRCRTRQQAYPTPTPAMSRPSMKLKKPKVKVGTAYFSWVPN